MRISTSSIYNANISSLDTLQVQIAQTTQQISSGQRILDPSMDPVGAARAIELTLSNSTNTQYGANNTAATNSLSLSDGILQSVTSLLQSAHDTAVTGAGGNSLSDTNRKALATDLQGRLNDLLGLANSTDGNGNYLYSGAQGSVQPFVNTAGGVVYQGDDVQRKMQVAPSRQISSSDSGADIFMRIRNGNGIFQAALGAANTGSGTISQGVVTNAALYSSNSYQVTFGAGGTTYSITDVTAGPPGVAVPGQTGVAYASGQAISFNGIQFSITGTPAAGDTFNVTPSKNQSVFDTLNNLITALNTPLAGASAATIAANSQAMSDGINALNQDLNSVLGVRATTGSRLNELTALQSTGTDLGLQYQKTLSTIQDTDYNKAITDLSQQKLILQAAQQSFAQVSKLSLFNYI
ncbi:flagellar hook-associated protein FlgL [Sideroxydans lithotrophicus]|uniref:Flagellar hook-associated protein 3 n=1 Tax=Sideroxydans lithotrophicus (strain ES-1) TaxID=580332 RepID=D5CMX9_SIDLE|nr:flagellar hook-associated protein FlgL [Sideroxydans lithotrophicus]ADE10815.1 flagellar hook-associated protein 3 [Sideroxydans lithotrophicus ES-1]